MKGDSETMSIPTKVLCLSTADMSYGTGLRAIRELADVMIDISDFADDNALGDSSAAVNASSVIKDDKVYRIVKSFFDLDNNVRILLATEEILPSHRLN